MKKSLIVSAGVLVGLTFGGYVGNTVANQPVEAKVIKKQGCKYDTKTKTLTTPECKIQINDMKVVTPRPSDTNGKTVLDVYYTLTNTNKTTKDEITPLNSGDVISAVQDTKGSQVDNLQVGMTPRIDESLNDKVQDQIKPGCSAKGQLAFELTNEKDKVNINLGSDSHKPIATIKVDLSKVQHVQDQDPTM